VLTGAGVSTESGIPDFRSPGGLWAEFDPLDYASLDSFRRDPVRIWDFYGRRFDFLADAEPNDAHRALAELERRGLVEAVVTQNIDLLHERAGSREVVEVHGSIRRAVCLRCGGEEPLEGILLQLRSAPAPVCPDCGSVLKPDVVFFGENVPPPRVERCYAAVDGLVASGGALLVAGSSLTVMSGFRFVRRAAKAGTPVVIVNRGSTRGDDLATYKVEVGCSEFLDALAPVLTSS